MLLTLEEREVMIFFLMHYGYDAQQLEKLTDQELMELDAEITEDMHV